MAAKSRYAQTTALNYWFHGSIPLYAALMTTLPTDTGGGAEIVGGSYGRVNTSGLWTAVTNPGSGGSQVANSGAVTFPSPTGTWGTALGIAYYDASTGGNLVYYGPLSTPQTINSGDPAPTFAAGSLTINEQ